MDRSRVLGLLGFVDGGGDYGSEALIRQRLLDEQSAAVARQNSAVSVELENRAVARVEELEAVRLWLDDGGLAILLAPPRSLTDRVREEGRLVGAVAGSAEQEKGEIPWALHVILVWVLMYALATSVFFGVGFFWYAFMLKRTACRARDILWILNPWVFLWKLHRTLWRATSRNVYWSTRPEYVSIPNAAWVWPVRWFKEIGKP